MCVEGFRVIPRAPYGATYFAIKTLLNETIWRENTLAPAFGAAVMQTTKDSGEGGRE